MDRRGEWKITLDVFRDLGLAFGGALLLIYILMVYQTGSYLIPLVQMISIPLTIIGIMPGFYLLKVSIGSTVGGYANPVYFTATANDWHDRPGRYRRPQRDFAARLYSARSPARGEPERSIDRERWRYDFRPILLTAGAAMLGAWPITLDPVFSGLAWSLIFGLVVSTGVHPRAGARGVLDALPAHR